MASKKRPAVAATSAAEQNTSNKKQLSNFIQYGGSDRCKNGEAKATATALMTEYQKCSGGMADKFAQKFMDTKKSKDFTWIKSFTESFSASKEEDCNIKENYLTPFFL